MSDKEGGWTPAGAKATMPIGHDIDLLCDAVEWAVLQRRRGTRIGSATIQRYVRVGFVKASRLALLMDDYGITVGPPDHRSLLVTEEQLSEVLTTLRAFASREGGGDD